MEQKFAWALSAGGGCVDVWIGDFFDRLCDRHFWDAFPPTTPELAEKAKKMFETLQKFQSVKVRPFETEVERR